MRVNRCGSRARLARSVVEDDAVFLGVAGRGIRNRARLLELDALVHEQRRVAAVVEDEVRAVEALGRPVEDPVGAGASTPRASRPSRRTPGTPAGASTVPVGTDDDGGRGLVLRREDVAARPAHLRAERDERLDQHRGLHRHVQRAGDAGAGERLVRTELLAQRHEARHLVLGEAELVASGLGERRGRRPRTRRVRCADGRRRGARMASAHSSTRISPGSRRSDVSSGSRRSAGCARRRSRG